MDLLPRQLYKTDTIAVPINGAETWARNKDIAKRLADFGRNVLRKYLGELKSTKIAGNDTIRN